MQAVAIIIFADSAGTESKYKILLKNPEDNLGLFEKLNREILTTVKKTGFPYFIFNEDRKSGNCYGECVANALAFVYDRGFEHAIIVRNDCPSLDESLIKKAVLELTHSHLVIGPDHWGGVYLLGISKDVFNKRKLTALLWESNLLALDLHYYDTSVFSLPTLRVYNDSFSVKIANLLQLCRGVKNRLRSLFTNIHASQNEAVITSQ